MLRFAPSLIGDMHIGDLRIAIINYIVAKQKQSSLFCCIDDMQSSNDALVQEILKKFALDFDQLIYRSQNRKIYQEMAVRLIQSGKAFVCTCKNRELKDGYICNNKECKQNTTPQKLQQLKEQGDSFDIRIDATTASVSFKDIIKGTLKKNSIDNFVILDSKGVPTDSFASAIDVMSMQIDYVIKDEDTLEDTFKEIYILNSLNYNADIQYAHLPKIINAQNISLIELLSNGFLPDAIINYLLDISNPTQNDIFKLPDAIKWFDLANIPNKSIEFDIKRLEYLNKEHLYSYTPLEFSKLFGFADEDIGNLAKLYIEDSVTLDKIREKIDTIFAPKRCNKKMNIVSKAIQKSPYINNFEQFKNYLASECNLTQDEVELALRELITQESKGPSLFQLYNYTKSYITEIAKCQ